MSNEKIREQFETSYKAACLMRSVPRFDASVFAKDHFGDYLSSLVQSAWWGWQASLVSLVVELPEGKSLAERMYGPQAKGGDELIARELAVDAIEAAGLKVQP